MPADMVSAQGREARLAVLSGDLTGAADIRPYTGEDGVTDFALLAEDVKFMRERLDEVTREREEALRNERISQQMKWDAICALAEAQAELREAREALEKVWAAIGDALCSGTGIDKAYSQAVASEVRAFLSRPASDGALRGMLRDAAREAWDAGHDAGSDGVNGPAADEQRDDDGEAIVSEIMEGK